MSADEWEEPGHVCAAPIEHSPWPELERLCDGADTPHAATWVVWTNVDTGDGMRTTCEADLADWIIAVGRRLW